MTELNYAGLYKKGTAYLEEKGIENPAFDAWCLFEKACSLNKTAYFLQKEKLVTAAEMETYESFLVRRAGHEPLQYILGCWDFMQGRFLVGRGVLIPRPETELLVQKAAEFIRRHPVQNVLDLCSGSGCIGISAGLLFHNIHVYCLEKSEEAFAYLEKNIALNGCKNVTAVCGDITEGFDSFEMPRPDVILSNPPYVEKSSIPGLQQEVLWEPSMALDGGTDGLDFYRIICEKWLPALQPDGFCAFECGENQARILQEMLNKHTPNTAVYKDYNGIERIVTAKI